MQIVANNKKAFFEYFILEKIEAGIQLTGDEVKSLRVGKASIKEAYADNGIVYANKYLKSFTSQIYKF